MSREVTVYTPENIPLTLDLAGLGSRCGAMLVDLALQVGALLTLFVAGLIVAATGAVRTPESARNLLLTGAGVVFFLIFVVYNVVFEWLWNGQTPGKRAFGLRVVRDGGYPVNAFAVLTRNLIRIADFLPAAYGVGALAVFFHGQYKRLGDMAAGTFVIKERLAAGSLNLHSATRPGTSSGGPATVAPTLPENVVNPLDALSGEEMALLRRFAVRRWEMTPDDSERLAYRLVVPLISRLNLRFAPGAPPRYADLVSLLVAAADAREEAEAAARF